MTCRSCGAQRDSSLVLRVTCNLHPTGHRDCLCPMYVCRPSIAGQRPDCVRRSVMGVDIHRIEAAL